MPETTIYLRSHLANYTSTIRISLSSGTGSTCWWRRQRIFWQEGLMTQTDCSRRDSRLSLCSLFSAYCLTILMLCGQRCRQRLCATVGDSLTRRAGRLKTRDLTSRDLFHCASRSSIQVNICCREYYMSCASVVCVQFYLILFNYSYVASYSYVRHTKWAVCVISVWVHY